MPSPLEAAALTEDQIARFWSRVVVPPQAATDPDVHYWWVGTRLRSRQLIYGKLSIAGVSQLAHRVSYTLAYGSLPPAPFQINHRPRCNQSLCVRPSHLYVGTQWQNCQDTIQAGHAHTGDRHWKRRSPERALENLPAPRPGEANPSARLREQDVLQMRHLALGGASARALASRFGISLSQAKRIVRRESWAHLPDPGPEEEKEGCDHGV